MNVLDRPLAVSCGAGAGTRWLTKLVIVSGLVMGGLATSAQAARSAYSVAINHRTLTITGNAASSRLALRLRAHHPNTLQIDVGDNGSADFQVQRRRFDRIRVNGGGGNDFIRIDELTAPSRRRLRRRSTAARATTRSSAAMAPRR